MPGFNQKGPEGQGPMTGRRMGRCTNYGAALLKNQSEEAIPSLPEGRFKNRAKGYGPGNKCSNPGGGWRKGR